VAISSNHGRIHSLIVIDVVPAVM